VLSPFALICWSVLTYPQSAINVLIACSFNDREKVLFIVKTKQNSKQVVGCTQSSLHCNGINSCLCERRIRRAKKQSTFVCLLVD
jgi:hypothetical protein